MSETAPSSASPPTLSYESQSSTDQINIDQREDGGIVITVPTRRGTFKQVLNTVAAAHPLGIVVAPILWPLFRLISTRRPRAIIWLTREEFTLTETSDGDFGWHTTSRTWPRREIGELRANRYGNGIYFRIPGKQNLDLLADLPAKQVARIGAALEQTLSRLAKETP
jgi:hypothetical protein